MEYVEYIVAWWKPILCVTMVGATLKMFIAQRRKRRQQMPLKHYKDGIVYIHMFHRNYTKKCVNLSPFAIKLETWCRMKKIPYQAVETDKFSPKERQVPWIMFNGEVQADSATIIALLKSTFNRYDELTEAEQGFERSIDRMLDDGFSGLYFLYRYWTEAKQFSKYFQVTTAPRILRSFIANRIGSGIRDRCINNGFGRYGDAHVITMGNRDLKALENILADKPFIFGDSPTAVDATVFGHLSQIVYPDMGYPWKEFLRTDCPRLVDHTHRMKELYWPDWSNLVQTDTFH